MEIKKTDQLLPEVTKLKEQSMLSLTRKDFDVSLYTGEVADRKSIISDVKRLLTAFPDADNAFIVMLVDRLTDNHFTKQRVVDSINHVIDTCVYRKPSIAEIISYDRKIKTFSYSEMIAKCSENYTTDNFEGINVNGCRRYFEK